MMLCSTFEWLRRFEVPLSLSFASTIVKILHVFFTLELHIPSPEQLSWKHINIRLFGKTFQKKDLYTSKVIFFRLHYIVAFSLIARDLIGIGHHAQLFVLLGINLLKPWCSKEWFMMVLEECILVVPDKILKWKSIWDQMFHYPNTSDLSLGEIKMFNWAVSMWQRI